MANWAKHKVRNFFEPRRNKRIKVQNDVPFGYVIENIIMLNKSEFDQGTMLNPLVHKSSQVLKFTIAIEIQAKTPRIQHHHQGAKKYHCCQKYVVGNCFWKIKFNIGV
jgi:hypothetical protein